MPGDLFKPVADVFTSIAIFQAKTDDCTYCKYINNNSSNNEKYGYSCIYKSQMSSMIYHI